MNVKDFESEILHLWDGLNQKTKKELNEAIQDELARKKLPIHIFLEAVNEESGISLNNLDIIEKIAILKGIRTLSQYRTDFRESDFFTPNELDSYESYVVLEEDSNVLVFKNVEKYNDNYYCCPCWKPVSQYKARKNRLVRYNFATQRQATITKDTYGKIRREITLNRASVDGIKKTIMNKEYFPPDTLTLNILKSDDKLPDFEYNEAKRTLKIRINYNIEDFDYTVVDFTDGWHRDTAIYELFNEGKNVEDYFKGFPVNISVTNAKQSAAFVRRQMLANKEDDEYLRSMEDNEYNDFIDKLNNTIENNILYNNIGITREEMLDTNKLTYKDVFRKALRYTEKNEGIEINNRRTLVLGTENYIKLLDEIMEEFENYKLNAEDMKIFTREGIYLGYFALWSYLEKRNYSEESKLSEKERFILISNFVKNIIENKEEIKSLKLRTKHFNIHKTYSFFKDLI